MMTTSRIRIVLTIAAALSLGNVACAESLFQRIPEPGRWCRYRTVLLTIVEGSAVSMPEQRGAVTVSALHLVEHNGTPHQWIEITNSIEVPTGNADEPDVVETMTYKCLIQRDQLQADGNPIAHIARGWLKSVNSEARELNVESFTVEGQEGLVLRFVMVEPLADVMKVTVPNSVRIGDEEFKTTEGVTGTLEPFEVAEGMELGGEFSYWFHEAAGFGVPASEFMLNVERTAGPNLTLKMEIAVQLEIEDQGDGAVSKLPDHE